jgi:hypothetical protein
MTLTSPRKALQRRLWALFMFFFIPGLLMASWATRTPPFAIFCPFRRDGHRAVRPVDRLHERHSLLRVAGKALWYASGDPHHHVLCRVRDEY